MESIVFAGLRLPQPAPITSRAFVAAFGVAPEEMFSNPIHPLAEANLKAQFGVEQKAIIAHDSKTD